MSTNQTKTLKCPGCNCIFFTQHDLKKHLQAFGKDSHMEKFKQLHKKVERDEEQEHSPWMPSKDDASVLIMVADKDPQLKRDLKINGPKEQGNYILKLSYNEKWIIKTPKGA